MSRRAVIAIVICAIAAIVIIAGGPIYKRLIRR